MQDTTSKLRDLSLLEEIERDPDTTQANLATRLGVAVGTVNWHLKRLVAKGYVKVKRAQRRKLRYIITPEGLALRARLTVAYIERSMELYRMTRDQARDLLQDIRSEGHQAVQIRGDGDLADVLRLTCLEQGLEVVESEPDEKTPVIEIQGRDLYRVGADQGGEADAGARQEDESP